jgi:hypothetical protein
LRVFDSVQTPDKTSMGSDDETVALIRRLHVLATDLQLAYSETENEAIVQCRSLLASADAAEAESLWQQLINVATEVRLRNGTVTTHNLLSVLRRKFELRHHPDYARDWEALGNITTDYKARIETELPSGHAIPRATDKASFRRAVTENPVTVIFGESGSRKSSLVKSVLDGDFASFNQVWFGPDELRMARRSNLPLRHELSATLKATVMPANVLVTDSAERIEPAEFIVIRKTARGARAERPSC